MQTCLLHQGPRRGLEPMEEVMKRIGKTHPREDDGGIPYSVRDEGDEDEDGGIPW
jgi:hypothetical protein